MAEPNQEAQQGQASEEVAERTEMGDFQMLLGKEFKPKTDGAKSAIHDAVSVVWSDVDSDGDLDLFLADRNGYPYVHLLINRVGQDNHFVQFDLRGTDTNRDAVGARITLTAGGVTQMRDVQGGGGHSNTQHSHIQHFGLGANTVIDEVTVRWVGGATETITGIEADHRYEVVEGSGGGTVVW